MLLGIISDTHDNHANTQRALEVLQQRGVEQIIHCGDVTTTGTLSMFEGLPVRFVFGNMDFNHDALRQAASEAVGEDAISTTYTAQFSGVRVAVCHGHQSDVFSQFVDSGDYDYLLCGHSHVRTDMLLNNTRVINPGALGGRKPQTRSFCILDLTTGEAEFIELPEQSVSG